MAIAVDLIFNTGNISLSNGSPYRIEGAEDLSPSEVIRLGQGGPQQDGVIDLGYRLAPRVGSFNLLFYATTDALLDTYRANLFYYFRPRTGAPLTLRYTRDDGTYRFLTCVAVDDIPIELVPEDRVGHLHRATIKVRAAYPAWSSAIKTATYTGSTAQVWYTAGGLINIGSVYEHAEWPGVGDQFTQSGTLQTWSVVFRAGDETGSGTKTFFHSGTGAVNASNSKDARLYWKASGPYWAFDGAAGASGVDFDTGSTANYMITHDAAAGSVHTIYRGTDALAIGTADYDISGTGRWRIDRSLNASTELNGGLEKAAVYSIALSAAQRSTLHSWMNGAGTVGTVSVVNSGDLPEYPYITIAGPITNPVLTNVATGDILDLSGLTLGSAESIAIDLRTGNKSIYLGTVNIMGSLSTPLQLAAWYIAPAPTASGGTNSIRVVGGSVSSNTIVTVSYYDRFMSF